LRLSDAMREAPEKSEIEVFREFTHRLTELQRQLDGHYQHEDFLRERLVISENIPAIEQSMRERVPKDPQDAMNRIATFLSSDPRSARAFMVTQKPSGVHYSIGKKYGGSAKRNLRGGGSSSGKYRMKLSPKWLAGAKGCYVCGQNHSARTRHSQEEVRAALEKLRRNHSSAMVSVEDLALIVENLTVQEEVDDGDDGDDVILSESEEESEDIAYIAEDSMDLHKSEEERLANISFMHGRTFSRDLSQAMSAMNSQLSVGTEVPFRGLHIDTCANRSSVMALAQYRAYCQELQVPVQIDRDNIQRLRGLSGSSKPIGTAVIPVPFRELNLVIDVTFQIVSNEIPTLLSMKDMKDIGLDISIQEEVVKYKHLHQPLVMENYFLIHRWSRGDVAYSLYTETELRKLHRFFGHPTVSSLLNILRRANPTKMTKEVRDAVSELAKACIICAENASRPKRFKLTIGSDELRFNHTVAVDVMYIKNRPVLHMVDEATHFSAASFLPSASALDTWKTILRCWYRTYLGPPNFLRVDQG